MTSFLRNVLLFGLAAFLLTPVARDALDGGGPQRWLEAVLGLEETAPPIAADAPAGAPASVVIRADRTGHYKTQARIDGVRVPVLVDTGATLVSLTADDARRLGLALTDADFKYPVATANGMARVAVTTIREIQLGAVRVRNVKATVYRNNGLGVSLLGMSFLNRLSRFEVADRRLKLVQ